jgi:hypothetical protein
MPSKSSNRSNKHFDDYDEEDYHPNKKKDSPRRRPIRNWKRVWNDKSSTYDEIDDFYSK